MSNQPTFDVECLSKHLETDHIGREVVYKRTTATTMDDALQLGKTGALNGTLVLTEYQTKARGYKGHTFNATNMGNIYASFVLHIPLQGETNKGNVEVLNPEIGTALAARRAVDTMGLHSVHIKWPNDLWIRGHKLAGFLIEPSNYVIPGSSPPLGLYILGVGLNVNSDIRRDPSLGPIATSVACELGGKQVSRERLLAKLCNNLEINLQRSQEELYKEFLQYSLFNPGDPICVHDEKEGSTYNAEIIEIQETWRVLIKNSDGKEQEIKPGQSVSLRPRASQTVLVVCRGETADSKEIFGLLQCLVDKVSTSVKNINATKLETDNWQKDTQILVVNEDEDLEDGQWKNNVAETVRTFVRDGGGIICLAHATEFASIWFPELQMKVNSLKTKESEPLSLVLKHTDSSSDSVINGFFGGAESKFFDESSQDSVIAWYSQDKKPAIVSRTYGKGFVCVCGIHIESVHTNTEVAESFTLDTNLFKRDMLMQNLLETCGLKTK